MTTRPVLIALCGCLLFCQNGVSDDTVTSQYAPKAIHYIKHGVPRIRTGSASDEKMQALAGPVHPGGSDLLVYKPADGYVFGPYDIIFKPSYTLILQ